MNTLLYTPGVVVNGGSPIDTEQLGGHVRLYDWKLGRWVSPRRNGQLPKLVMVPMKAIARKNALWFVRQMTKGFTGGFTLAFASEPQDNDMSEVFAMLAHVRKNGMKPLPPRPPKPASPIVFMGLAYTRLAAWLEEAHPFNPDHLGRPITIDVTNGKVVTTFH